MQLNHHRDPSVGIVSATMPGSAHPSDRGGCTAQAGCVARHGYCAHLSCMELSSLFQHKEGSHQRQDHTQGCGNLEQALVLKGPT